MFISTSRLAIGRRVLALVGCVGMTFGIAACTNDVKQATCKDVSSNSAAVDAMAKVAMGTPALAPYVNPTNNFGAGGQVAVGSGIDEGGLTSEFKNQIKSICAGANAGTQPYETALGNTVSFARTGSRVPAPSENSQSNGQAPSSSNGGSSGSDQGSATTSGGSSPGQASGGSTGGESNGSQSSGSSGSQSGGSQSSGSKSSGSSGTQSNGSNGSSSGGQGSSGASNGTNGGTASGGSSSSQGTGNPNIPPCGPPTCAY
jgi:hypothetical protein